MKHLPSYIKFALPKGKLLPPTANLLSELALGFQDYSNESREYRLHSEKLPQLSAKIFQEKDIPIQVAIGNYDFGICGLDWIEELLARYPSNAVIKIADLDYGKGGVYVVAGCHAGIANLHELQVREGSWRMVSEYPNLAEALALNLRLKAFKIFPVWGAAEVYPPEDADLAVLWGENEGEIAAKGLTCLWKLLPTSAFLIANQKSLESKELGQILTRFSNVIAASRNKGIAWVSQSPEPKLRAEDKAICGGGATKQSRWDSRKIKLALPDGHQQLPAAQFLKSIGLELQGYSEDLLEPRPSSNLDWVSIKVIRPQDMPLQVANGNFDLAITGEDWLLDHLYRFPTSPVAKLLGIGFGKVSIVAAMSYDVPVANVDELRGLTQSGKLAPLRVASEYINIADKYLRDNHISPYKLIPTWGASEAFLPEDADLLIDNTETGKTLAQHNLKIVDTLFQSTACLIGNENSLASPDKKQKIDLIVRKFQVALP
jgi:ATP phosphoribosyltransferase